MTPFEYSLVLVSIIVGLAIADLLASVHRLLRARQRIRWHWHPLAATVLVLLVMLQFWWGFYLLGRFQIWSHYWAFLLLALQLILMFLLACAALPDEVPDRLDLASYYEQNRKYFWTLFALVAFTAVAVNLVLAFQTNFRATLLSRVVPNLLYGGVILSLAFVRSRVYHSGLIILLLLVMTLSWFSLQLR